MPEILWAKDLPLDAPLHEFTVGADRRTDVELLPFDIEGSAAHARMLGETGLLGRNEAVALVQALQGLHAKARRGELIVTAEQEDGHTAIEAALTQQLGDTGRRIHLARSRNDQVQTALRLLMRSRLLDLGASLHRCALAFHRFAAAHRSLLIPGYTHMRRAMPSSWGLWAAAFAEGLQEELEQLPALWMRLDRSPLGAAAGFGSPVPIDRERSAELLGFSRIQRSPIDVMNSRGRHEHALAAWAVSAACTIEKALWDLLIWSGDEYGFVQLPDAFTTGSSLMPQKRNPDALELARGRCRELRALANTIAQVGSGLPSSYHRDHQLLKAPLLEMLRKSEELYEVVARVLPNLTIDAKRSAAACTAEVLAADEACRLAAEGMPFRDAYAKVAQQLQRGEFEPARRKVPAPEPELEVLTAELAQSEQWIAEKRQFIDATREKLFDWK